MVEVILLLDDEFIFEETYRSYMYGWIKLAWVYALLDYRASKYMSKPRAIRLEKS